MPHLSEIEKIKKSWVISEPEHGETYEYTTNQLIEVWNQGVEKGVKQKDRLVAEKFSTNINKLTIAIIEMISFLRSKGIPVVSTRLKADSSFDLCVMTIVNEKDFLDENFLQVYDFVEQLEKKINDQYLHSCFRFLGIEDTLNEKALYSDGFVLTLIDYK